MMELSEAEIEARLSDLRRRREALDREIADHVLYLELGRRARQDRLGRFVQLRGSLLGLGRG
ncbi:hypothetical protein FV219_21595, partial [Methylobacterium sp. WL122]